MSTGVWIFIAAILTVAVVASLRATRPGELAELADEPALDVDVPK